MHNLDDFGWLLKELCSGIVKLLEKMGVSLSQFQMKLFNNVDITKNIGARIWLCSMNDSNVIYRKSHCVTLLAGKGNFTFFVNSAIINYFC